MTYDELNIDTGYPCSTANYARSDGRNIEWIIIHYTGSTGSGLANVRFFMRPLPEGQRRSAHFFVGHAAENAQIYQSVPPGDIAWHIGTQDGYVSPARNDTSLGIEACCHNDTADLSAASRGWYFDAETLNALTALVRALMDCYGVGPDHVLRHYDVTRKICPAMWVHDERGWENFKTRLLAGQDGDFDMIRYQTLSDIPNGDGFRDIIGKLMTAGILLGDGSDPGSNNDVIDLSSDQVRLLIMMYRGGGFDDKLRVEGLSPAVGAGKTGAPAT